jgi:ceramide glucosyltransferase
MDMKYSVICPLCEYNELLSLTLESLFQLHCSDYEIIFAAEPEARAAIRVAEILCQRYPAIASRIVVVSANYCINPKLNNVQKAWLVATGQWVLMTDCNMLLPGDAIQRLESRWNNTIGMVCSPPAGTRPANFWAAVECAFLNQFEAKWQLLADRLGYGFVQGKVMFCHKTQFDTLGGLLALDMDHAACEDAAATKLIRRAGLHVRLVTQLFEQPLGIRSLRQVWKRQLRWAKLRRVTFPHWYALEILITPVPFLLAMVCAAHVFWPVLTFLAFFALEIGLAKRMGWYLSWLTPAAMVARDGLMIAIWIAGWFGDDFQWAGQTLTLHPAIDSD